MEIGKKVVEKRVKGEISSRVNRIKNKNDEIIGIKLKSGNVGKNIFRNGNGGRLLYKLETKEKLKKMKS